MWRTDLTYFWTINCEANMQDDMHYHENDDHIFMVLEGECTVRTPENEYVLKPHDMILLESGNPYQLCNTGEGRLILSRRGQLAGRRQAAHPGAEAAKPHSGEGTDHRLGLRPCDQTIPLEEEDMLRLLSYGP